MALTKCPSCGFGRKPNEQQCMNCEYDFALNEEPEKIFGQLVSMEDGTTSPVAKHTSNEGGYRPLHNQFDQMN